MKPTKHIKKLALELYDAEIAENPDSRTNPYYYESELCNIKEALIKGRLYICER